MKTVNPLFTKKIIMYIQLLIKSGLTVGIFDIANFSIVWCCPSLHLMEIFPMTHNFWKKDIIKHWLTVVKKVQNSKNIHITQSYCNICHGVLVMTLFWQVSDNNSLKLIMWQLMHHFGAVFCHFAHGRV